MNDMLDDEEKASPELEIARLRADSLTLASMEGERDALLARCREAMEAIDTLIDASKCVKQCAEIGDWCRCGVKSAKDAARVVRDRIALALAGGVG